MWGVLSRVRSWLWRAPAPPALPDEVLLQFARTPALLAAFRRTCRRFRYATGNWDVIVDNYTVMVDGEVVYADCIYSWQTREFGKCAALHCMLVGRGDVLVYGGELGYVTENSEVMKLAAVAFPGSVLNTNGEDWTLWITLRGTVEHVDSEIARLRAIAPESAPGYVATMVYVIKYIQAKDAARMYSAV